MRAYRGIAVGAALVAAVALLVPACGRDHHGTDPSPSVTPVTVVPGPSTPAPVVTIHEDEPNDSPDQATKLPFGFAGQGSQALAGLDVDYWRLVMPYDSVVRVQLFAHRVSQQLWLDGGTAPTLELMDVEGLTVLQAVFAGAGDPEIPGLFLPEGQYMLRVSKADPTKVGGRYVLLATLLDSALVELASIGGPSNNTESEAQPLMIPSGLLAGVREPLHDDYYVVPVPVPGVLRLAYRAQQMSADFDPVLELIDSVGQSLATLHDGIGLPGGPDRDAVGSYAFVAAGKCVLRCGAALPEQAGPYVLEWSLTPAAVADAGGQVGIALGAVVHGSLAQAGQVDRFAFMGGPGDQVIVEVCDGAMLQGGADAVVVDVLRMSDDTPIAQSSSAGAAVHNVRALVPQWDTYYVRVRPDDTPVPTEYMFHLRLVRSGPHEPLKDAVQSMLPDAGVICGAIDPAGDTDAYVFAAAPQEFVVFRLIGGAPGATVCASHDGWGSSLQGRLVIRDAATKALLATAERFPTASAQGSLSIDTSLEIAFVAPHGGAFLVYVAEATGAGGPERFYLLERD